MTLFSPSEMCHFCQDTSVLVSHALAKGGVLGSQNQRRTPCYHVSTLASLKGFTFYMMKLTVPKKVKWYFDIGLT